MNALPRRFRLPWRREEDIRRDVDDELRFHQEMRERELVGEGMEPDEARRRALEEFGDIERLRRACTREDALAERSDRRAAWLDDLATDATQALRAMRRARGATLAAIATIGLGIGANTALFGAVHHTLLAPLPYADAERVVRVYGTHVNTPNEEGHLSSADVHDFAARQRSFDAFGWFTRGSYTWTEGDAPLRLQGVRLAPSVLEVLGVRPALGRPFTPQDALRSAPYPVIVSDSAWRRLLGADPGVIGRVVRMNGVPREVVGVMPAGFRWPEWDADVFVALDLRQVLADQNRARGWRFLSAYGRLRDGVTSDDAAREMSRIAADLAREHPRTNSDIGTLVRPLRESIVGRTGPVLLVLFAAAALVLLIACANVAGLLLARAVARRQEIAVRAALGAGRGRLARQMLAESLVLALAGCAAGVAIAWAGTRAIASVPPEVLPALAGVRLSWPVLAFAVAAAIACGVLFGSAPALLASRGDLNEALRDAGRGASSGAGRHRLRAALVTGQMALALALLVSAGLLGRTLANLARVELGFAPTRLLVFDISLPGTSYDSSAKEDAFFDTFHERLRAIPGVAAVGSGGSLPLAGGATASLAIEGRANPASLPEVGYSPASDDYFRTLRIPLLRGRTFGPQDREEAPGVVVITETVARRWWPDADPVGARVRLGPNPDDPWSTVVGVVGDVRHEGAAADLRPTVYVSQRQDHWGFARFALRVEGDPRAVVPQVRAALRATDPSLPLETPRTMDEIVDASLATRRLPMQMIGAFAILALILSAIGIYSVTAYAVSARTREIGTRLALGATPRGILAMILRQAATSAVIGSVIGIALAVAGGRLLRGLLFGVEPVDVPTIAAACIALVVMMLLAALVPARLATRLDPTMALRAE